MIYTFIDLIWWKLEKLILPTSKLELFCLTQHSFNLYPYYIQSFLKIGHKGTVHVKPISRMLRYTILGKNCRMTFNNHNCFWAWIVISLNSYIKNWPIFILQLTTKSVELLLSVIRSAINRVFTFFHNFYRVDFLSHLDVIVLLSSVWFIKYYLYYLPDQEP